MTNFARFLKILAFVLVLSGAVFSDEDGGSSDCPIKEQELMNEKLITDALGCLIPDGANKEMPDFLRNPDDVNAASEFFHNYCSGLHKLHQCLEGVRTEWNKCHDDLENSHFGLFKDLIKTTKRSFCSGNGAKLIKVWKELQPLPERQSDFKGLLNFLKDCVERTGVNIYDADVPFNRRIFVVYRRLKDIGKCMFRQGKDMFISTSEIRSRISEILQKMKCHHPERKRHVLCSTLNEEGSGDRTCTVGSHNDSEHQIRRELINQGFQCISFRRQHLTPLSNNSVQEDFVRFLNESCNNLPEIRDCLAEVNTEAVVCLKTKSHHQVYKMFQDMTEVTVESGCSEDGQRLAQIFISDASSEGPGIIGECIDISVTRFKHIPFEEENASTITLKAYREANRLEQCFFQGLEHDDVREAAKVVMDDVTTKMMCVDPENGSTILCKTIEGNSPGEVLPSF